MAAQTRESAERFVRASFPLAYILAHMRLALVLRFSVILAWTAFISLAVAAAGTDSLNWRTRQNRVDARIESMDLQTVLAKVSAATGWIVYVEPDTTRQVSAKFKNTPSGEALTLAFEICAV